MLGQTKYFLSRLSLSGAAGHKPTEDQEVARELLVTLFSDYMAGQKGHRETIGKMEKNATGVCHVREPQRDWVIKKLWGTTAKHLQQVEEAQPCHPHKRLMPEG